MTLISMERSWSYDLTAEFGACDATSDVVALVSESAVTTGVVVVQMVGSTGAITTIEFENGALADLKRALDVIAPATGHYAHNARWGDGNGFSHLRSALLKTSLAIPVAGGELALGTWQQIVVINFDNRKRSREVVGVVTGV